MLLSTYRRRRYQSDPGDYKSSQVNGRLNTPKAARASVGVSAEPGPKNDAGVQTATQAMEPQGGTTPLRMTAVDPQNEFDEYGTELHRDARVWKVYVEETDRFDGELVKGWNDSTDVILIFAALFSAISTAFLIESSKMLQPDPTDLSARTLAVISQTLLTLANGTQLPASVTTPPDDSAEFVPSPTAIYVNTLWYLSLSLSLATSFIAILSKDWCHSFMSGRTGQHYTQTCRRQQKWDMLERWKMSELLALLPSIIHLALLLFSVGLCILLWDMHSVVAVPVICVSGVAFGFYVWSSVAAILLDSFPYPTIVSVICRTKPARLVPRLVLLTASQVLRYLAWHVLHLILRPLEYLFDRLVEVSSWLRHIDTDNSIARFLVRRPAYIVWDWLTDRSWNEMTTTRLIDRWFTRPEWIPEWTRAYSSVASMEHDKLELQGQLASLALRWIIKNCEVPRSVDIALQSIAGASQGFFCEPLLECDAAMEISKRLASSNSYRGGSTETVVLLYSRALSYLSSSGNKNMRNTNDAGDNMEVTIWQMQTQIESNVAGLITDGQFQPSRQNLDALRIGNTAASRSLRLLQGDARDPSVDFDSITNLMQQHLNKAAPLHPASLLSLVNAATLLSLLCSDVVATLPISTLCVRLASNAEHTDLPRIKVALITCAVIQRARMSQDGSPNLREDSSTVRAIQTVMRFQSHDDQSLRTMLAFGLEDLWNTTWLVYPDNSDFEVAEPITNDLHFQFLSGIHSLLAADDYNSAPPQLINVLYRLHPFRTAKSKLVGKQKPEHRLIGMIWNLGATIEEKLAALTSDGTLKPSQSNLEALRLSGVVGLTIAKILNNQLDNVNIEGIVNSATGLLKSHLNLTATLHDAALLSVTYAATLLSLIVPTSVYMRQNSPDPLLAPRTTPENPLEPTGEPAADCNVTDALTLPSLCRQIARDHSSDGLITILANTYVLWCNMYTEHTRTSQKDELDWKIEAVWGLVEICFKDKTTLAQINNYIELLIDSSPTPQQTYNLALSLSQLNSNFWSSVSMTASTLLEITAPQLGIEARDEAQGDITLQLHSLCAVYHLTAVTVLYPDIYLAVVDIMCRSPPSSAQFACGAQMLSKCPFPTLSEELATALEQRDLVPLLETTLTSDNRTKRYFARGQLWLLLSLYIYAGDTESGRDKLKVQLDKCRRSGDESEERRYRSLGVELYWEVDPGNILAQELGVWVWRLEECVCQFRGATIWRYTRHALRDVPPELRGLSSFTGWPRRADNPPTNEPRRAQEVAVEVGEGASTTDPTTQAEGATGGDAHAKSAGSVEDAGEAGTQEAWNNERADSSRDIEANAQVPEDGAGESVAASTHEGETNEVRKEDIDGLQAVDNERKVADKGDAMQAVDGTQSEGEETEKGNEGQGGGNEGDVVIPMDSLEDQPSRSMSNV